jgi:hypothetical protein
MIEIGADGDAAAARWLHSMNSLMIMPSTRSTGSRSSSSGCTTERK